MTAEAEAPASVPAGEAIRPADAFAQALKQFAAARMNQVVRDETDPDMTAVNHSLLYVQFSALIALLVKKGLITRDEFQIESVNHAAQMTVAMEQQRKLIVSTGNLHS